MDSQVTSSSGAPESIKFGEEPVDFEFDFLKDNNSGMKIPSVSSTTGAGDDQDLIRQFDAKASELSNFLEDSNPNSGMVPEKPYSELESMNPESGGLPQPVKPEPAEAPPFERVSPNMMEMHYTQESGQDGNIEGIDFSMPVYSKDEVIYRQELETDVLGKEQQQKVPDISGIGDFLSSTVVDPLTSHSDSRVKEAGDELDIDFSSCRKSPSEQYPVPESEEPIKESETYSRQATVLLEDKNKDSVSIGEDSTGRNIIDEPPPVPKHAEGSEFYKIEKEKNEENVAPKIHRTYDDHIEDEFEDDSISQPLSHRLSDSLEVLKESPHKDAAMDESLLDLDDLPSSSKNSMKSNSPEHSIPTNLTAQSDTIPPEMVNSGLFSQQPPSNYKEEELIDINKDFSDSESASNKPTASVPLYVKDPANAVEPIMSSSIMTKSSLEDIQAPAYYDESENDSSSKLEFSAGHSESDVKVSEPDPFDYNYGTAEEMPPPDEAISYAEVANDLIDEVEDIVSKTQDLGQHVDPKTFTKRQTDEEFFTDFEETQPFVSPTISDAKEQDVDSFQEAEDMFTGMKQAVPPQEVKEEDTFEDLMSSTVTEEHPSIPKPKPSVTISEKKTDLLRSRVHAHSDIEISHDVQLIMNTFNPKAWFNESSLHPKVGELVYWRDPKKSGAVFGSIFVILIALTCASFISVVAYTSLLILSVTSAFRIYKSILQAIQKTQDGYPFKEFMEMDVSFPSDKAAEIGEVIINNTNRFIHHLRRLFLVEDLVDSFWFAVYLYCMTFVGGWFNGLTLIILGFVAMFSLPKVYEMNQTVIDQYIDLIRGKISELQDKVKESLPFLKKEKAQ